MNSNDKTASFRGSRLHILNLLDSPGHNDEFNRILKPYGVSVSGSSAFQPGGHADPEEWTLRQFCSKYCAGTFNYDEFDKWWVSDQYKNPTWDLLATCLVNGRPGLLLVEAKAHEGELDWKGKLLRPDASDQSHRNHQKIGRCIAEARSWLNRENPDVAISVVTHYQLSNRIACAWKLASCGLPAVLLYLGFIGDTYFEDHFADADHWQRVMGGYFQGIIPQKLPGTPLPHNSGGMFLMLVKSLQVLEASQPLTG